MERDISHDIFDASCHMTRRRCYLKFFCVLVYFNFSEICIDPPVSLPPSPTSTSLPPSMTYEMIFKEGLANLLSPESPAGDVSHALVLFMGGHCEGKLPGIQCLSDSKTPCEKVKVKVKKVSTLTKYWC